MVEQGQQHTTITVPGLHVVVTALPRRPCQATLMPHLLQHPRFLCFYFSSPHKANVAQKLHQVILYSMLTQKHASSSPKLFLPF